VIVQKPFGRTGHISSQTIFGAAALGSVTQEVADRTLELLLEYGVNHIDTAASYGDSELRVGPWMSHHRSQFFLATKTGERSAQEALESLERSLERLQVEQVDLIQMHALVDPGEWEVAMGPGGALEGLIKARERKLTRFIGVTGHGTTVPAMHLRSLSRFDFDTVLLPYNYMMGQNVEYMHDFQNLLELCRERNTAVQTIKSIARGPYPNGDTRTHTTWYAPLVQQKSIDKTVAWVLSNEQVFLNTAGDITLLPMVLDAAETYGSKPSNAEMESLVALDSLEPLFT
jgi:aryl-alcohol dehydrogenase-like predicted oxidoreductase